MKAKQKERVEKLQERNGVNGWDKDFALCVVKAKRGKTFEDKDFLSFAELLYQDHPALCKFIRELSRRKVIEEVGGQKVYSLENRREEKSEDDQEQVKHEREWDESVEWIQEAFKTARGRLNRLGSSLINIPSRIRGQKTLGLLLACWIAAPCDSDYLIQHKKQKGRRMVVLYCQDKPRKISMLKRKDAQRCGFQEEDKQNVWKWAMHYYEGAVECLRYGGRLDDFFDYHDRGNVATRQEQLLAMIKSGLIEKYLSKEITKVRDIQEVFKPGRLAEPMDSVFEIASLPVLSGKVVDIASRRKGKTKPQSAPER